MTAAASAPLAGRVARQRDRLGGGLGAAVHDQGAGAGLAEAHNRATALVRGQLHALARRAAAEHAVGTARLKELDQRADRVLVQRGSAVLERRDRGAEQQGRHRCASILACATAQRPTCRCRARRCRVGHRRRRHGVLRRARWARRGCPRAPRADLRFHHGGGCRRIPPPARARGGAGVGEPVGRPVPAVRRGDRAVATRPADPPARLPLADPRAVTDRRATRAGRAAAGLGSRRRRAADRRRDARPLPMGVRGRGAGAVSWRRRADRAPEDRARVARGLRSGRRARLPRHRVRDVRRAAVRRCHRPGGGGLRAGGDRRRAAVRRRRRAGRRAAAGRALPPPAGGAVGRAGRAAGCADDDR